MMGGIKRERGLKIEGYKTVGTTIPVSLAFLGSSTLSVRCKYSVTDQDNTMFLMCDIILLVIKFTVNFNFFRLCSYTIPIYVYQYHYTIPIYHTNIIHLNTA